MAVNNRGSWAWPVVAVSGIVLVFIWFSFRAWQGQSLAVELPKQLELVDSMRLALVAASDSQNDALIAQDKTLIDNRIAQANKNLNDFRQAWTQLQEVPALKAETAKLSQVQQDFEQFAQIQSQVEAMLKQNTNRRAYESAMGEHLALVKTIDAKLSQLTAATTTEPSADSLPRMTSAYEIRLALLRIQSLLIPHISEPSNEAMDKLEMQIKIEDDMVKQNLNALTQSGHQLDQVAAIQSQLEELQKQRTQILKLSRENSNIKSEALAMNERRVALLECDASLIALKKAIQLQGPSSLIPGGR